MTGTRVESVTNPLQISTLSRHCGRFFISDPIQRLFDTTYETKGYASGTPTEEDTTTDGLHLHYPLRSLDHSHHIRQVQSVRFNPNFRGNSFRYPFVSLSARFVKGSWGLV